MERKRLVILGEGHGDVLAAQVLVMRLLKERNPWECLFLDPNTIRVGGAEKIMGTHKQKWVNALGIAHKRGNLGAALLLLDGDHDKVESEQFCAANVARTLAMRARE